MSPWSNDSGSFSREGYRYNVLEHGKCHLHRFFVGTLYNKSNMLFEEKVKPDFLSKRHN